MSTPTTGDSDPPKSMPDVTAEQVIRYLKAHPDFFVDQDVLLSGLTVPHKSGKAISLVERQMLLLREHNSALRQRLSKLVGIARDNDRLFEQTRKLVLSLLESQDLEQAVETLKDGLEQDFKVDFYSLILFTGNPDNLPFREMHPDVAEQKLGDVMAGFQAQPSTQNVICGCLPLPQLAFLFPERFEQVGSAALVLLNVPNRIGVMALGCRDENHFRATMDSLFLTHLGDVASRLLSRLMPEADPS